MAKCSKHIEVNPVYGDTCLMLNSVVDSHDKASTPKAIDQFTLEEEECEWSNVKYIGCYKDDKFRGLEVFFGNPPSMS